MNSQLLSNAKKPDEREKFASDVFKKFIVWILDSGS